MKPNKQVKEWFKLFRQIPPQSHFTGIDDKEAIECVKVLINILIKEKKGTIDSTVNYINDDLYYLECLKQLESIKVKQ
jgi:hypothetical protein